MVFRNDLDLKELQQKHPTLRVTLVDHHIVAPKDVFLTENIVSIFDHRPIDKSFKKAEHMEQVVIEEVGSCSTLIAREVMQHNERLLSEKTAVLLYGRHYCS